MIKNFLQELRTQRWDDHRYYHHSRINQSLHFVSAASFLFAYVMSPVFATAAATKAAVPLATSKIAALFLPPSS